MLNLNQLLLRVTSHDNVNLIMEATLPKSQEREHALASRKLSIWEQATQRLSDQEKVVQDLKNQINSIIPISRLCPEILSNIMLLVIHAVTHGFASHMSVTIGDKLH
ncbi:hypothetical protein ABKN59_010207 [Abortiporus biennis]